MTNPCLSKVLGLLSLGLAIATAACAAPTESEPPDELRNDALVSEKGTCSRESYDKAFLRYKAAVDHAKARARGDVCGDGTMLHDIANDLGAAVATCGEFQTIIATSKWAAPARDALKGNLGLAVVDGRLRVKDAAGKVVFAGLKDALPGVTVFGPAPGVYGNVSKITFGANGAAKISRLDVSDDGATTWKDVAATYSIGAVRGSSIAITIVEGGKSTVYELGEESYGLDAYETLPEFILKPISGGDDFRSMPSECEA